MIKLSSDLTRSDTIVNQVRKLRGGMNQLYTIFNSVSLKNKLLIFCKFKPIDYFITINHRKWTETQNIHVETHKGKKPLLLMDVKQATLVTSCFIWATTQMRLLPQETTSLFPALTERQLLLSECKLQLAMRLPVSIAPPFLPVI